MNYNVRKGSATIEAAFIIPFTMIVLVNLIYLSFFLYNRLILTEASYIAALRSSRMEWSDANERYKEAEKASSLLLENSLLVTPSYQKQIVVKKDKSQVRLRIEDKWEFEVTKDAERQNPYQFIRECRRYLSE